MKTIGNNPEVSTGNEAGDKVGKIITLNPIKRSILGEWQVIPQPETSQCLWDFVCLQGPQKTGNDALYHVAPLSSLSPDILLAEGDYVFNLSSLKIDLVCHLWVELSVSEEQICWEGCFSGAMLKLEELKKLLTMREKLQGGQWPKEEDAVAWDRGFLNSWRKKFITTMAEYLPMLACERSGELERLYQAKN